MRLRFAGRTSVEGFGRCALRDDRPLLFRLFRITRIFRSCTGFLLLVDITANDAEIPEHEVGYEDLLI